jgi:hypothetical protein
MHTQPLSDNQDCAVGFLRLFLPHLQHKTNRTFTKLVGVLPGSGHDSILSKVEVSTETGAVQGVVWVVLDRGVGATIGGGVTMWW